MLIEIDSIEILAYILNKTNDAEKTFTFRQIREFARELESKDSRVVADGSRNSVVGFRSIFIKNVTINRDEIKVVEIKAIKPKLQRYIPKYEFMKVLDEVEE